MGGSEDPEHDSGEERFVGLDQAKTASGRAEGPPPKAKSKSSTKPEDRKD